MSHQAITALLAQLEQVLLGKPQQIKLAITCILAKGHLLIEDLPGMGKTSLSQGLAQSLGLSHQRVQFTSDMLPADILGVSIFDKEQSQFVFHPGPIFKQMVLADEINRASPKTQSALLEAMAEQQITVDGITHPLPSPFFVIATQNPSEQSGTFPLPESQLDRFMMRLSIGYPDSEAELAMLKGEGTTVQGNHLPQCIDPMTLKNLQQQVLDVKASDALLNYILALINGSRQLNEGYGLSPRASKSLLNAAKAWAFIAGRHYIVPEDVQAVFPAVAEHRLRHVSQQQGEALSHKLLNSTNPIL
ncbi:ATPase AAA [Shewanella colwelliana]|uniref:AAA family ATPase n=1 Tax=Shewanella colwelliana TaxID=23 RepID=A0A1E5IZ59_SHECO|nr:MoxR family ATPase [Shewanella colwelliana]MDX1282213.1 MoxR family ATPase [Shewanella colwelliana]OEG75840.1 AAA family ATPase [Shewanella colwelliana]GIU23623.1 ATPase AAA [Shewanella colwelliana]GIU42095.1 ATPase AAA [Shewanella colwelliana]